MTQITARKISILLVDDHALFRDGLSRLLEAEGDFTMAGACADIETALEVVSRQHVDLILLDYDLGEESGRELLKCARTHGYLGPILIVTAGVTNAEAVELIQGGVAGIVLKHNPPALLAQIIHKVIAGETWFEQRYWRGLVDSAIRRNEREPAMRFTERERQVLRGVFEGLTNKEIAERTQVSESSVKGVLQQLFDKTGVRTRSQLVRIALEQHRDKL